MTQNREITAADYDMLLALDRGLMPTLGEHLVQGLRKLQETQPVPAVADVGSDGDEDQNAQCQHCSCPLIVNPPVIRLRCGHTMHETCLADKVRSKDNHCATDRQLLFPGLRVPRRRRRAAPPTEQEAGSNGLELVVGSLAGTSTVRPDATKALAARCSGSRQGNGSAPPAGAGELTLDVMSLTPAVQPPRQRVTGGGGKPSVAAASLRSNTQGRRRMGRLARATPASGGSHGDTGVEIGVTGVATRGASAPSSSQGSAGATVAAPHSPRARVGSGASTRVRQPTRRRKPPKRHVPQNMQGLSGTALVVGGAGQDRDSVSSRGPPEVPQRKQRRRPLSHRRRVRGVNSTNVGGETPSSPQISPPRAMGEQPEPPTPPVRSPATGAFSRRRGRVRRGRAAVASDSAFGTTAHSTDVRALVDVVFGGDAQAPSDASGALVVGNAPPFEPIVSLGDASQRNVPTREPDATFAADGGSARSNQVGGGTEPVEVAARAAPRPRLSRGRPAQASRVRIRGPRPPQDPLEAALAVLAMEDVPTPDIVPPDGVRLPVTNAERRRRRKAQRRRKPAPQPSARAGTEEGDPTAAGTSSALHNLEGHDSLSDLFAVSRHRGTMRATSSQSTRSARAAPSVERRKSAMGLAAPSQPPRLQQRSASSSSLLSRTGRHSMGQVAASNATDAAATDQRVSHKIRSAEVWDEGGSGAAGPTSGATDAATLYHGSNAESPGTNRPGHRASSHDPTTISRSPLTVPNTSTPRSIVEPTAHDLAQFLAQNEIAAAIFEAAAPAFAGTAVGDATGGDSAS